MENDLRPQTRETGRSGHDLQADADDLVDLVMTSLNYGSWRIDLATGKCWMSRRIYQIHGLPYSREPVDLESFVRAYYAEDAKTIAKLIMHAIEKKNGFSYTLRLERPDGTRRTVEAFASVKISQTGKVESIYGLLRDVTDSLAKNEVADARGRLLKSVIQYSPMPIAIVDRAMNYIEVSPSWAEHHGLGPVKKTIGKNHLELMPDLPESWKEDHAKVLAGQIVKRDDVMHDKYGNSSDAAGVLLPWQNGRGRVGGIIMMHVPREKLADEDMSFLELADLVVR